MNRSPRRRSLPKLLLLGLLAAAYCGVHAARAQLSLWPWVDGAGGVLLGLLVSATSAANLLDALVYQSEPARPRAWFWLLWLPLNGLVAALGVMTIILGAMQFVRATV